MADDDYDNDEQPGEQSPRDLRQQLKEAKAQAKELPTLQAENVRLKQELVIRDAGISLNERQRVALAATHNGDWTPEAVRKSAEELGFVQQQPPAPVVDDPSLAAIDNIAAASAGTDAPPATRDAELERQLSEARTEAEFLAAYRASGRPMRQ